MQLLWELLVKLEELFEKMIAQVVVVLFTIMVLITFIQTFSRYALDMSIFWAEELARFSMIWLTFLGAAIAVKRKEHMNINFFVKYLPARIQKWIKFSLNILLIVFVIVLSYNSLLIVKESMFNISQGLGIPLALVNVALLIAGIIMVFYLLMDSVNFLVAEEGDEF